MPVVTVETFLAAPPEVCFDLARDIGLHCATASHTQERAVAGVTIGLIGLGESVTFEGVHFGIRQRLTARVIEFERPHRFVDEMTQGAFKALQHVHEFMPAPSGTLMKDTIIWVSPFGILGILVDRLCLERHMKGFVMQRNAKLKEAIEKL
jgi:ligand-binding SRPBCC domain-containing protein